MICNHLHGFFLKSYSHQAELHRINDLQEENGECERILHYVYKIRNVIQYAFTPIKNVEIE